LAGSLVETEAYNFRVDLLFFEDPKSEISDQNISNLGKIMEILDIK